MYLYSVLALILVGVSDGTPQFRSDYIYHSSVDGWLKLHAMPSTWSEARLWCHYEGVPLNKILVHWALGQPDNKDGQEQCIALQRNGEHYELADVRCDQPRPFLCFKKNSQDMPKMNECGTIDAGYGLDNRTGHCYKLHRLGLTWPQAFKACTAEGAYLAIVNSEKEAQVLRDLIAKHPQDTFMSYYKEWIGVGFRDWSGKGTQWMTINGQTLKEAGYEKWGSGNPNSPSSLSLPWVNEHCGIVFRSAELGDIGCDYTIPFICEMDPRQEVDDPEYSDIEVRIPIQD